MTRFVPSPRSTARPLVALLALVAVLTAACGSATPYAAKVNGTTIAQSVIEDELRAIRDNDAYVDAIEGQAGLTVRGSGSGTVDAGFVAQVVTRAVAFELIAQELADREVDPTEQQMSAAREQVLQQVGGQEVFDAFDPDYQELLVLRLARVEALAAVLAAAPAGPEAARAFYEDNPQEFEETCLHHIVQETEDEALAVIDRLEGGADFEALAIEVSTERGSGAVGGDLGCAPRRVLPPPLDEFIFEAPVGEVSGPVESAIGWHVIQVDDRRLPPFEEVARIVENQLAERTNNALNDFISQGLAEADVEVSPRYGTWSTGFSPQVVPPNVPTTIDRNAGDQPTGIEFNPFAGG